MELGQMPLDSLNSVKQALGYANLRKAMNKDATAVNQLLDGMEKANAKTMENSVTPHKGSNIDIRL